MATAAVTMAARTASGGNPTALGENRLHVALETDGHRDGQSHRAGEGEKNAHAAQHL